MNFTSAKTQVKLVMCPGRTDYEYKSEAYMLDREFTKHGRHPPIIERPITRVENMAEFYNPTCPSHFRNGSLVRKRRVYSPHEM